jgi:hypothetical protein
MPEGDSLPRRAFGATGVFASGTRRLTLPLPAMLSLGDSHDSSASNRLADVRAAVLAVDAGSPYPTGENASGTRRTPRLYRPYASNGGAVGGGQAARPERSIGLAVGRVDSSDAQCAPPQDVPPGPDRRFSRPAMQVRLSFGRWPGGPPKVYWAPVRFPTLSWTRLTGMGSSL